jgi:hypothetical protein
MLATARIALAAVIVALAAGHATAVHARVLDGLAIVQDDGSLHVGGEKVWLFGAYLPIDGRQCQFAIRPPRCAARSVLALNNLVTGFVRCEIVGGGEDGLAGICTTSGRLLFGPREDLAAQLILDGWALATPDAPDQYRAFEALARTHEAGLWAGIANFR